MTRFIGNYFKGAEPMKEFDRFPKVMKKLVRYIKQDASLEQLEHFKKELDYAIEKRAIMLKKTTEN